MKSFDELYNNLNFNNLNVKIKKEHERVLYFVVGLIMLLVSMFIISKSGVIDEIELEDAEILLLFPIFPIVLILGIIWKITHKENSYERNSKTYLEIYKEKIIFPIVKNCFPIGNYYPNRGLAEDEYKEMEYNEDYNVYKAEDLIETTLITKCNNQIYLKFSDLYVAKKVDQGIGEFYFFGMIGHTKIDKTIVSYIKITTKNDINETEEVLMDSSEFEKYFNIESPNKIMAMQILTSDIMLNIIDIWNKTKVQFEIILKNNDINMKFFTGNMFETTMNEIKIEKQKLKKFYDILEFVKNISIEIYDAISEADV